MKRCNHILYQLPLCLPIPGKLSVLVMDNARIHRGEGVREPIEGHGGQLVQTHGISSE